MRSVRIAIYIIVGACAAFYLIRFDKKISHRKKPDTQSLLMHSMVKQFMESGVPGPIMEFACYHDGIILFELSNFRSATDEFWDFVRKGASEVGAGHVRYFPDDFGSYFGEKPGDKVTIVCAGQPYWKSFDAVVEHIGVAYDENQAAEFIGWLKPIRPDDFPATDPGFFIVTHKMGSRPTQLISFREYPDALPISLVDSLGSDALKLEANLAETNDVSVNDKPIAIRVFGADRETLPDTLVVMTVHPNDPSFAYTTLYRIVKSSDIWQAERLNDPSFGAPNTKVECSLRYFGDEPDYMLSSPSTCEIYWKRMDKWVKGTESIRFQPGFFE
jgi:hypothetical protein